MVQVLLLLSRLWVHAHQQWRVGGDHGQLPVRVLKCSSTIRYHRLVETFWGWGEQQLPDGTPILTSPAGHTYVTTPGSALLFPSLCRYTAGMPTPEADPPPDYCGERHRTPTEP
jgi:hypothetical protein